MVEYEKIPANQITAPDRKLNLSRSFQSEESLRSLPTRQPRRSPFEAENKLVMASLLQEFQGKVDMIYSDPPFDVHADFSLSVTIDEVINAE